MYESSHGAAEGLTPPLPLLPTTANAIISAAQDFPLLEGMEVRQMHLPGTECCLPPPSPLPLSWDHILFRAILQPPLSSFAEEHRWGILLSKSNNTAVQRTYLEEVVLQVAGDAQRPVEGRLAPTLPPRRAPWFLSRGLPVPRLRGLPICGATCTDLRTRSGRPPQQISISRHIASLRLA